MPAKALNINVGILGHVDSGKTSLSKALSTYASTSAFDKNPESKLRGITLDLGFSSFVVPDVPAHLQCSTENYDKIQFTLVDCPGHASLIRTIICGSHIIDAMLLVIDINKGIQTQTAECIVIGELTCDKLIIVLNKLDQLQEEKRLSVIEKMTKRVKKALEVTKFKDSPIVCVSANIDAHSEGISDLIYMLLETVTNPTEKRLIAKNMPFIFAVDHCFGVTGQGTVLTGTVSKGSISVGDTVELPYHRMHKKIKSMQMFKKSVNTISAGERAGICIAQLDPNIMERGLLASTGTIIPAHACILSKVQKIRYFKGKIESKKKFHVSVGHETVLARVSMFHHVGNQCIDLAQLLNGDPTSNYFKSIQLLHDEELLSEAQEAENDNDEVKVNYLLVEFEKPVCCSAGELIIGSKLDVDPMTPSCRIAFHGTVDICFSEENYLQTRLSKLPVYKKKIRTGFIDRVSNSRECIVKGLFKKETNWSLFDNLLVTVVSYEDTINRNLTWSVEGRIVGNFGQTGKCRVSLFDDLPEDVVKSFSGKAGKKSKTTDPSEPTFTGNIEVILQFKRYIFNNQKRFIQ